MEAILELIKTLIPFGIAFLFLWGIGRICCTKNGKPQQQADRDQKQRKKKQKQQSDANKKDMFDSKEEMMKNKQDLFSSKKPLIRESNDDMSELDVLLSLPVSKQKKLTSLQKAYLLKEVLDAPKAIKPYRRKYPR